MMCLQTGYGFKHWLIWSSRISYEGVPLSPGLRKNETKMLRGYFHSIKDNKKLHSYWVAQPGFKLKLYGSKSPIMGYG